MNKFRGIMLLVFFSYSISIVGMMIRRAGQSLQKPAMHYYSSIVKKQPEASSPAKTSWWNNFKSWISGRSAREKERAVMAERLRKANEVIAKEDEALKKYFETRSGAENARLVEILLQTPERELPYVPTKRAPDSAWGRVKSWFTRKSTQ